LHFDCFAGISGDMTLGALIGLGVPPDALENELRKLPLPSWSFEIAPGERCGIAGTCVTVHEDGESGHAHTHWSDIRAMIDSSKLDDAVKCIALSIFTRLAEAEGKVHGVPADEVAFHEVGAVDSIVDIVGAAFCIAYLQPQRITAGELELGGGVVYCAHGALPVPAPAVLELCRNIPVRTGGFDKEMTTPTGAAILAACVDEFISTARFREVKTAYGLGRRRLAKPNALRASLRDEGDGRQDTAIAYLEEELVMLETSIDDMTGEAFGFLMETLFEEGALDVTLTPCVMKKSRPGTTLCALCRPDARLRLRDVIFTRSTTLGIREYPVLRAALPRETALLSRAPGTRVKTARLGERTRSKIEYEDRARLARERNISLDEAAALLGGGGDAAHCSG
jgi:uncharacterized protein (TIGR00299 family) protein